MTNSGVVAIRPIDAYKLWAPLPGGSYFRVNRGGETITLGISQYLPCSGTYSPGWDSCGFPANQTYYYNQWCGTVDTFFLSVLRGDTIRSSFQAEYNNPTDYVDHFGNWWRAVMNTYSCNVPLEAASLEFVLNPDTAVRIVNHEPREIWPYLPPETNGDSRGANRPGYNPIRGFQIRVYDLEGQAVSGASVRIRSEFVPFSGGHEHNNPVLPANRSGLFYKSGSGSNPKTLTTDSTGTAVVDSFRASQIAGRFLITASLVSDSTVKDTVNLNVRVPILVDLSEISTHIWTLVGAIPGNHTSNHWSIQRMQDSLVAAIVDFYAWTGTPEGGGTSIVTLINDMSLIWGGAFEYEGDWNLSSQHSFHRVGLSVDINRGSMEGWHVDQLTVIIEERYGGSRHRERPRIHYGFDGGH